MTEELAYREQYFWPKVQKSDGCWEWLAAKQQNGYGMFHYSPPGESLTGRPAHRFSFALRHNRFARTDHQIHHTCKNHGCVNPDHLVELTSAEHARLHREVRAS